MAPRGSLWPNMASYAIAPYGSLWLSIAPPAPYSSTWPQLAPLVFYFPLFAPIFPYFPLFAPICPYLPIWALIDPNCLWLVLNAPDYSWLALLTPMGPDRHWIASFGLCWNPIEYNWPQLTRIYLAMPLHSVKENILDHFKLIKVFCKPLTRLNLGLYAQILCSLDL